MNFTVSISWGHFALIFLLLLLMSAFFSASETALFSLSSIERKRIANRKDPSSRLLTSILKQPGESLITVLVGNMLVNTTLSCFVTLFIVREFGANWLGACLTSFTVVLLVFGEVIPKNIAFANREHLSLLCAPGLYLVSIIVFPLKVILLFLSRHIFRLPLEAGSANLLTEEKLKTLVELGAAHGVLGDSEREKITNLISFGKRTVREIMVPRTDMVTFDIEEGREALEEYLRQEKANHAVIYRDQLDMVQGTIRTRDLLLHPEISLRKLIQPPVYVPEQQKIDELIMTLTATKNDLVICVDEYGGTAGMVSHDEIIRAIFGEMPEEEHEEEEAPGLQRQGAYVVFDGATPLYEVNRVLARETKQQDAPILSDEASITISGYLLDLFDEIPQTGRRVVWRNVEFIVSKVERNRILEVKVRVLGDGDY